MLLELEGFICLSSFIDSYNCINTTSGSLDDLKTMEML